MDVALAALIRPKNVGVLVVVFDNNTLNSADSARWGSDALAKGKVPRATVPVGEDAALIAT